MNDINGTIEGDIAVNTKCRLTGRVRGDIVARSGAELILDGTCSDDLLIEPDAIVYLNGTVEGSVYNGGGSVEVHGVIAGNLYHNHNDGKTVIDEGADIKGQFIDNSTPGH